MSQSIRVTLADGSVTDASAGMSAREILGPGACGQAVGVLVNGDPKDLDTAIDEDCTLATLSGGTPQGLEILRHSTAHLLAHAVQHLFPAAQITIGPVVEDGFYYDIQHDAGFTPEDLERLEAEMKKIAKAGHRVVREDWDSDEAARMFEGAGQSFKAEIIRDLGAPRVSLYRQGDFVDLCRGPHVPNTKILRAFKLLSVAGAYWRGNENNPQLQRIYGTAFADKQELADHLERLEQARARDHRKLGRSLGLFSFHSEAPGSPFFRPDGAIVYNRLVDYIRSLYARYGYDEVITPQVLDVDLWHRSGHYENYRENMYFTEIEERQFAVKPMNCPTHCLLYGEELRSYRDLPLRIADFGRLHRFERSGTMHGLTRVRSFCQDDAHIFCAPEQIGDEIRSVIRMIREAHDTFGFQDTRIYLSTRPEKALGEDSMWEHAESTLHEVLRSEGASYQVNPGDGAFYGPKIDFCVLDAMKREWQLSTVQLDFFLPERFELQYISSENTARRPVMIHRAVLGSLERFIGMLIEHTAGALPLWLAPRQVVLVTVTDRQNEYALEVADELRKAGARAHADVRNEKLGFKIREAQAAKIPVVGVIGDREMETRTVAPRLRGGEQLESMSIGAFTAWIQESARPGAEV